MSSRGKTSKVVDFADADDSDSEQEPEVKDSKTKTNGKTDAKGDATVAKKKSGGLNWSAICIILMMVLPAVITLAISAYDMMYPKLAAARMIREKIQKCYSAAKPNEVVDIEKIMKKYNGKERALFANLRNKYPKFPACQVGI